MNIAVLRNKLINIKHAPFFEIRTAAQDAVELAVFILDEQDRRIAKLEKTIGELCRGQNG